MVGGSAVPLPAAMTLSCSNAASVAPAEWSHIGDSTKTVTEPTNNGAKSADTTSVWARHSGSPNASPAKTTSPTEKKAWIKMAVGDRHRLPMTSENRANDERDAPELNVPQQNRMKQYGQYDEHSADNVEQMASPRIASRYDFRLPIRSLIGPNMTAPTAYPAKTIELTKAGFHPSSQIKPNAAVIVCEGSVYSHWLAWSSQRMSMSSAPNRMLVELWQALAVDPGRHRHGTMVGDTKTIDMVLIPMTSAAYPKWRYWFCWNRPKWPMWSYTPSTSATTAPVLSEEARESQDISPPSVGSRRSVTSVLSGDSGPTPITVWSLSTVRSGLRSFD
eukprot:m.174698 g.174698  ORF g.174698 m.174698 type:complete len:333 (-) comp24366_c0_seq2:222-1220(-)